MPETIIRRTLSELRQGGAESPAKVFTSEMLEYAEDLGTKAEIATQRKALCDQLTYEQGRGDSRRKISDNPQFENR